LKSLNRSPLFRSHLHSLLSNENRIRDLPGALLYFHLWWCHAPGGHGGLV
jgi:hypothetical protein